MALFEIKNLSFKYGTSEEFAIENINMEISEGDFLILFGKSGSGKTTLLKMLDRLITPYGTKKGEIFFSGENYDKINDIEISKNIAYISQDSDKQIVTDRVYKEIAFNLENIGEEQNIIRKRVAESVTYFGLNNLFYCGTNSLSGGEKKLVALAGALTMRPKVLILDEPFSQLDPISESRLIFSLQKLNRENGITIVISQHNLDGIFDIADKIAILDSGKLIKIDTPLNIAKASESYDYFEGMPSVVKLYYKYGPFEGDCPLNVSDGIRIFKNNNFILPKKKPLNKSEKALSLRNIYFSYEKNSPDIIKGLSFDFYSGNVYTVIGGNGCGKSTLLKLISGLLKPYSGNIKIFDKNIKSFKDGFYYKNIAFLPQNPISVFSKETLREDIDEMLLLHKNDYKILLELSEKLIDFLEIKQLLNRNPFDLSGGELQKAALCKVLLQQPEILLLDEASKGLDYASKKLLTELLLKLKEKGLTVISITHDTEFAYEVSDCCIFMFDGDFVCDCEPRSFFMNNTFFTLPICRFIN